MRRTFPNLFISELKPYLDLNIFLSLLISRDFVFKLFSASISLLLLFIFCLFDSIIFSNFLNFRNLSDSSLLFLKNKYLNFYYLNFIVYIPNDEFLSHYAYLTRPDLREKAERLGLFKLVDD